MSGSSIDIDNNSNDGSNDRYDSSDDKLVKPIVIKDSSRWNSSNIILYMRIKYNL